MGRSRTTTALLLLGIVAVCYGTAAAPAFAGSPSHCPMAAPERSDADPPTPCQWATPLSCCAQQAATGRVLEAEGAPCAPPPAPLALAPAPPAWAAAAQPPGRGLLPPRPHLGVVLQL